MRHALDPVLLTGQRSSDFIPMQWDDYGGSAIQITQEKTATRPSVPCRTDLKVELTEWKRNATSVTILVAPTSRRFWNRIGFPNVVRLAIEAHSNLRDQVFHGLRNASATPLAETGNSALEIPAHTGHISLNNPEISASRTNRCLMTDAAIATLDDHRPKHGNFCRQPFGSIRLLQIETKVDLGFPGVLWHTTFGIADGAAPTPEEASSIPAVMS